MEQLCFLSLYPETNNLLKMKKLYTLSLVLFGMVSGFAQVFYSESMGVPTGNTDISVYVTGTAPATFQNGAPIVYSGDAQVRTSSASNGYAGATGGGNVFFSSAGGGNKTFIISGLNSSAYSSADIELSFGYLTSQTAVQLVVEVSTDGNTWTPLTFTNNSNTSWNLITIGGGQIPSSNSLSIRFTGPPATSGMRVDDVTLRNGTNTCTLVLGTATTACGGNTATADPYTATIPFTGGGSAGYTIIASAGTVGGDDPNAVASGNITVSGITEGTALTVTVTGNTCSLTANVASPQCGAINELPFTDSFNYTAGTALTAAQIWSVVNPSSDNITVTDGSLTYPGVGSSNNSVTFVGGGTDAAVRTTPVTSGTIYASFLMSVTDYSNVTSASGQTYFASMFSGGSAFNGRVWIKKNGTQFQLGGTATGTAVDTDFSSTLFDLSTTILVVEGYDFTTNELKFWFNPDAASFSAATPASITVTPATAFTSISGFLLRQDSDNLTPNFVIDEFRMSTDAATLLSIAQNQIEGLKVYPNPVTNGRLFIDSANNGTKTVAIYDVLGKQVLNTTTSSNEINVAAIKGGVYIVKITEEGKTATRKLVIK